MATHVACPNCFTLFRLERIRPGRPVRCGNCRERFEPTHGFEWSAHPSHRGVRWRWVVAVVLVAGLAAVGVFWRELFGLVSGVR